MKSNEEEEVTKSDQKKLIQLGVAQIMIIVVCTIAIVGETKYTELAPLIYASKILQYIAQSVVIVLYSYDGEDIETIKKWLGLYKEKERQESDYLLEDTNNDEEHGK